MRYALRNQKKIAVAFSPIRLKHIIDSLAAYFNGRNSIPDGDCMFIADDKFKTLIIPDVYNSTKMIALYVIEVKYDVYRLAFKEFIE